MFIVCKHVIISKCAVSYCFYSYLNNIIVIDYIEECNLVDSDIAIRTGRKIQRNANINLFSYA